MSNTFANLLEKILSDRTPRWVLQEDKSTAAKYLKKATEQGKWWTSPEGPFSKAGEDGQKVFDEEKYATFVQFDDRNVYKDGGDLGNLVVPDDRVLDSMLGLGEDGSQEYALEIINWAIGEDVIKEKQIEARRMVNQYAAVSASPART